MICKAPEIKRLATKATRPGWVYFAYAPEVHRCKIGWTDRSPKERFATTTDCPGVLNIWGMLLAYSVSMEAVIHEHFSYLRVKGEWFAVDDRLRTFVCDHTYKSPDTVQFVPGWRDRQWTAWDTHLAGDYHAQELIKWCQTNPVELVKTRDPTEYFYNVIQSWIVSWFGYAAGPVRGEDNFYRTSEAYDLIYEMCYDLLPV